MTMRQLAVRLNAIIAEEDARRAPDGRVDQPLMFEIYRGGRKNSHYYPVNYASSALVGMGDDLFMTISGRESERKDPRKSHAEKTA